MTTRLAGTALAAAAAVGGAFLAPQWAHAVDLAPHRAVYAMALDAARPAAGIAGAHGTMTYEFKDGCDGWTVENRTELIIDHLDRPRSETAWEFVAWEAKSGDRYRFWVTTERGGRVVEEIEGSAEMEDGGGVARFISPRDMTVDLPPGTLFPMEHTLRMLEAAEGGERLFLRPLFDGTEVGGPSQVNAIIGKEQPADGEGLPADLGDGSALLDVPSWHVSLAFFPLEGKEAQPDYEVSLRYFANGVGTDIRQDFGDFALQGRLEILEPLPPPDC